MNKITKVKKYEENVYSNIGSHKLILFGIYSVIKKGESCTFERLVAECFTNFPKVFAFKRYPEWPDSLKFDRALRTLRDQGLIVGSARHYFSLTKFGEMEAIQVEKKLKGKVILNKKEKKSIGRSIDDRLIFYLKNSVQFKKYTEQPASFSISEAEFRDLLRCTLETPERILKQNLNYYKNIAKSYNEQQLIEFLSICEKKFFKGKSKNG